MLAGSSGTLQLYRATNRRTRRSSSSPSFWCPLEISSLATSCALCRCIPTAFPQTMVSILFLWGNTVCMPAVRLSALEEQTGSSVRC